MKFKNLLYTVSVCTLLLTSCSKKPLEYFNSSSDAMVVIRDATILNKRTSTTNAGPIAIINKMANRKLIASTGTGTTEDFKPEIALELIKEIFPPTINGVLVRVTHVAIEGNYAYIGYNREGDVRAGGIDILDITDINDIKISRLIGMQSMDISTVYADNNNHIHFSGASDVGYGIPSPAISGYFNHTSTELGELQSLRGTTATDFVFDGDYKYVVSGTQGEIVKIRKSDNKIIDRTNAQGLLAVRANDQFIVALSADEGLRFYDKESLVLIKSFNTIRNNVEHKRHIYIDNEYAYVAEGTAGLGIYNIIDGVLKNRITIPTNIKDFPFVGEHEVTTIAMSFDNNKAFVANGAGGISIYKYGTDKSQFTYLGSADLKFFQERDSKDRDDVKDANEISSNYILAKDNMVFVAGGRGGLKILRLTDLSDGSNPTSPGEGSGETNPKPLQCESEPGYVGFTDNTANTSDFNTNQTVYKFVDNKTLVRTFNLNTDFYWCGNLVTNRIRVNSGTFTMGGTLTINQESYINDRLNLSGEIIVKNKLSINGQGILSVSGTVTVEGELWVDGSVVFLDNDSKIILKNGGKISGNNKNSISTGRIVNN